MNLRKTAVVVLLLALVLVIVWGCGEKEKPDIGKAGTGEVAEGEGGPLAGQGTPGASPGMGTGPGGPGPGAPGMGMGPGQPGAGATPPATPTGSVVSVEELIEQGIEDKNAGRLEHAEMKLRAAVLEEDGNEDAHWALAWTLAAAEKNSEAIAEFEKVLELTADAQRTSEAKAAIQRLQ